MAKIQDIVADSVIFEEGALRLDGDVASADLGDKNNHFYGVVEGVRGFHEVIGGSEEKPELPPWTFIGSAELLTGTISAINGTTVTGTNTLFLTEVSAGDRITVTDPTGEYYNAGAVLLVSSVTSDTELTIDADFTKHALPNDSFRTLLVKLFDAPPAPGGDGTIFNSFSSIEEAFSVGTVPADGALALHVLCFPDAFMDGIVLKNLHGDSEILLSTCAPSDYASGVEVRDSTMDLYLDLSASMSVSIERSRNVDVSSRGTLGSVVVSDSGAIVINADTSVLEVYGDSKIDMSGAVDEVDTLDASHLYGYQAATDNVDAFTNGGDKFVWEGMTFFHRTLNKPVWYSGSDWVDATGTIIVEE